MSSCQQIAVPDPQLLKDAYMRQILVPLRKNQQALAQCLSALSTQSLIDKTLGSVISSNKLTLRSTTAAALTAVAITEDAATVTAVNAMDLASAINLANANKSAINVSAILIDQLVTQQNALISDQDNLVGQLQTMKIQLAAVVSALNRGA